MKSKIFTRVFVVLTSLLFVVVSALSAPAVELFRYRYHAEDGREFECVFETDEQSVPKTVGEEKATEIAMDSSQLIRSSPKVATLPESK